MAEQVSIWRWAVTEGLEALFEQLIAASDEAFMAIASAVLQEGDPSDAVQMFDDAEAKVRAMGLPAAELATTLAGLKAMREEALAANAVDAPEPDGRVGIALASSHMFVEEPFSSLSAAEITEQVAATMNEFRVAISAVVGSEGQSLAAFLGLDAVLAFEDAVVDVLLSFGLAEVEWMWVTDDHALFLSHWQEDKELPVDLEFGRVPLAVFVTARGQIARPHEM